MEREFASALGSQDPMVRESWSPFRLSPLGAHTDHQLGLTCGFSLDHGIRLKFRRNENGKVRLRSRNFPGEVDFELNAIPEPQRAGFGDYVCGIARELERRHGIWRGIDGELSGDLGPGGISTSAALEVAVLIALLDANDMRLDRHDAVQVVVAAERTYAGVEVGILDPSVILFGQMQSLVVIDCQEGLPRVHKISRTMPMMEWVLIDSGLPRDLRTSPYNQRVEECRAAARAMGSTGDPPVLREITPETFRRMRKDLDPVLRNRAEHFFSENKRVKLGLECITCGDLEGLGQLVSASGESLSVNFDCGTPETRDLLELLREAPGVLGASYAGGGFGGMVQALARPNSAGRIEEIVKGPYTERHRQCGQRATCKVVGMGPRAAVR